MHVTRTQRLPKSDLQLDRGSKVTSFESPGNGIAIESPIQWRQVKSQGFEFSIQVSCLPTTKMNTGQFARVWRFSWIFASTLFWEMSDISKIHQTSHNPLEHGGTIYKWDDMLEIIMIKIPWTKRAPWTQLTSPSGLPTGFSLRCRKICDAVGGLNGTHGLTSWTIFSKSSRWTLPETNNGWLED